MKPVFFLLLFFLCACSTPKNDPTIKAVLLEQLKNSHSSKNWYVPANIAVEGLTAEQANWTDSLGNHSIGQLAAHLIFWNERVLISFKGNEPPDFNGNNDETFTRFDKAQWEQTVKNLDEIMTQWEQAVETASDAQLDKMRSEVANIASHNAYHIGQIVLIRKQNGWWDAEKGVK